MGSLSTLKNMLLTPLNIIWDFFSISLNTNTKLISSIWLWICTANLLTVKIRSFNCASKLYSNCNNLQWKADLDSVCKIKLIEGYLCWVTFVSKNTLVISCKDYSRSAGRKNTQLKHILLTNKKCCCMKSQFSFWMWMWKVTFIVCRN